MEIVLSLKKKCSKTNKLLLNVHLNLRDLKDITFAVYTQGKSVFLLFKVTIFLSDIYQHYCIQTKLIQDFCEWSRLFYQVINIEYTLNRGVLKTKASKVNN